MNPTEDIPAPHARAVACEIEIVERVPAGTDIESGPGLIVPNEIRINGTSVLAPTDKPVIVHEIAISPEDCVQVTLTLFARRILIREEPADE